MKTFCLTLGAVDFGPTTSCPYMIKAYSWDMSLGQIFSSDTHLL